MNIWATRMTILWVIHREKRFSSSRTVGILTVDGVWAKEMGHRRDFFPYLGGAKHLDWWFFSLSPPKGVSLNMGTDRYLYLQNGRMTPIFGLAQNWLPPIPPVSFSHWGRTRGKDIAARSQCLVRESPLLRIRMIVMMQTMTMTVTMKMTWLWPWWWWW